MEIPKLDRGGTLLIALHYTMTRQMLPMATDNGPIEFPILWESFSVTQSVKDMQINSHISGLVVFRWLNVGLFVVVLKFQFYHRLYE